jgi:hypothetical protein
MIIIAHMLFLGFYRDEEDDRRLDWTYEPSEPTVHGYPQGRR